jgi:hypothetical protein
VQPEVAAERLGAVSEPDEACAVGEVGAAEPVVADAHAQGVLVCGDLNVDGGGVRVLGGIGQRLRDHVVGGDLGLFGQPSCHLNIQVDRDGGAARQRAKRRPQPALGQDGRVQATGGLAQLIENGTHVGDRVS